MTLGAKQCNQTKQTEPNVRTNHPEPSGRTTRNSNRSTEVDMASQEITGLPILAKFNGNFTEDFISFITEYETQEEFSAQLCLHL